ncbi:lysozyme inhibitor LprI family protein [Pseudomonas frederiksbergensis]|uniref:lysozyme inhibitor LprI family protein n=1 Tax=Pseudomonas frederiksbergensis TaxID=104087 RepID=UPI003D02FA52
MELIFVIRDKSFVFWAMLFVCSYAHSASFDCNKASTEVERKICGTPSLSALDEQLSAVFKPLKNILTFQIIERDWLETQRNTCESTECLEDAYDQQIRFLTPLPEVAPVTEKDVKLLPADKIYTQSSRSWRIVELSGLPNEKGVSERFLLSAEMLTGMLHVMIFEGHYDVQLSAYKGNLYEYVDRYPIAQPIIHTIAKDIGFDGAVNLGGNDEGKRFAGILDGSFYYREQITRNQQKGMVYKLGSNSQPKETSSLIQQWSNSNEHAIGGVMFGSIEMFGPIKAYYSHSTGEETIAPANTPGNDWYIYSPIWSKSRPVFYFKNGSITIWRANILDKTLTKVVSGDGEDLIQNPTPVDINGREAVVYLHGPNLKIAIAPDE